MNEDVLTLGDGGTTIDPVDMQKLFNSVGIGRRVVFNYKCIAPECGLTHQLSGIIYGADMVSVRLREITETNGNPDDQELLDCLEYIFFRDGGLTFHVHDAQKFMRLQAESAAYVNPQTHSPHQS